MAKRNSTATPIKLTAEQAQAMDFAMTNVLSGLESLHEIAKGASNNSIKGAHFGICVEQMTAHMLSELHKGLDIFDGEELRDEHLTVVK